MDSLTQATLGALCGELLLRKQIGWKGMAWGLFFGTLPDLDVFAPHASAMDALKSHRGLSHSLFLMVLLTPAFGSLLSKLHKAVTFKRASAFVFLTWFTHVLIDCFNSYGTQVLEPFSDYRVSFGNMAIADLFFTVPMLLGLIICLFFNKTGRKRTILISLTTAWISLYALASVIILTMARGHFEEHLTQSNIHYDEMLVSPTLSNIFLWRMVARNDDHYYVSYWSIWDATDRQQRIDTIQRTPDLAIPFQNSKTFDTLNWFSKGWWKVFQDANNPNELYFVDMRFGEFQNSETSPLVKIPPFLWRLTADESGNITEQSVRSRREINIKKTLHELKERALGRAPNWHEGVWIWESFETTPPKK